MWAHKLSYKALWRVLWPILTSWAKDNRKDDTLIDLSTWLASDILTTTLRWTQQHTAVLSLKLGRWQILSRNLTWFIKMIWRTAIGGSACTWSPPWWGSHGPSEREIGNSTCFPGQNKSLDPPCLVLKSMGDSTRKEFLSHSWQIIRKHQHYAYN